MTLSKLFLALSGRMLVILVSKRLGAIVTTRMPYRAKSRASGKVKDAIAPLDAEYATWPGWPSNAAEDETRIRTPRSLSLGIGVALIMCGKDRRTRSSVPRRLMLRTKSIEEIGIGSPVRPSTIYRVVSLHKQLEPCGYGSELS
jgi:hypothetical protein